MIADNKGFICQQCGLLRDKEEIAKITKEMKSISEKASMSLSSSRILEPVDLDIHLHISDNVIDNYADFGKNTCLWKKLNRRESLEMFR